MTDVNTNGETKPEAKPSDKDPTSHAGVAFSRWVNATFSDMSGVKIAEMCAKGFDHPLQSTLVRQWLRAGGFKLEAVAEEVPVVTEKPIPEKPEKTEPGEQANTQAAPAADPLVSPNRELHALKKLGIQPSQMCQLRRENFIIREGKAWLSVPAGGKRWKGFERAIDDELLEVLRSLKVWSANDASNPKAAVIAEKPGAIEPMNLLAIRYRLEGPKKPRKAAQADKPGETGNDQTATQAPTAQAAPASPANAAPALDPSEV